MKYTLLVTQNCNLACEYCYIGKRNGRMSLAVASKVVEFAYRNTPPCEKLEVAFFGGEPLLEFERIRQITDLFESHSSFDPRRTQLTIVTNGTIFSPEIADFINVHDMGFGISCDGPPDVHDSRRRSRTGGGTGHLVERTIRASLDAFPAVMVNAVYDPLTLTQLPRTVEYLSSLGVRQIYLNPDFTARWTASHAEALPAVFAALGELYVERCRAADPHFISPIDGKISVLLRGGYDPLERCRMGRGEFAFTPEGGIYPCERLVGDGGETHRLGSVDGGIEPGRLRCHEAPGGALNRECLACSLRAYCMNWCGCSNYFSSGRYNRVGPFLCAAERAALRAALDVVQSVGGTKDAALFDHLGGTPLAASLWSQMGRAP